MGMFLKASLRITKKKEKEFLNLLIAMFMKVSFKMKK